MNSDNFTSLIQVSPLLTDDKLTEALTDWFKEPIHFTHWEYVNDTGKGDSYLSEVIRIRIYGASSDNTIRHVQVILKNIPKNKCRRLTYRSHEFFKNEINFYQLVLPGLIKFQSEKNLKEPFDNCAKLFFAYSDGVNDAICLEDAGLENYGPAVRQEGIDIEHCKTVIKTLAKFHAMSFAMKDQKPEDFEKIGRVVFETYYDERLIDWYQNFWHRICGIAIDAVEKEYPDSIYVDKIRKFAVPERYFDMIEAVKTHDTGVISHGDCWTNNFLFKYVNQKPVDAKLIDFQLTRCASPVLDLSFLIYACTSQDLREKHYEEILQHYYRVLSMQVKDMGSDPNTIYSWSTFMEEVKKYSYFGLAFSFESMPFIVLAPEDAVDMEIIQGEEKRNIDDFWQVKPFKTKEARLRSANCIVHCVNYGYI